MSATDSIGRTLPRSLEALRDFALDLRWTWSHAALRRGVKNVKDNLVVSV